MGAIILFLMPIASGAYDFRTDVREDTFNINTAAGVTAANVTLLKALYDDDTSTISFSSNVSEAPTVLSWNGTNKQLGISDLTESESHQIVVSYDVTAFQTSSALDNLIDKVPWIWLLMVIGFVPAALIAIFMGRA